MNLDDYGKIGAALAAFVGWFVRLEYRFGQCLTRAEHEKICEARNKEINEKLDLIREDVRWLRDRLP